MIPSATRASFLATLFAAFGLASTPAAALTVVKGVTYTLTKSLDSVTQAKYTLVLTGINVIGVDTEGSRSGVNAIAFSKPETFLSVSMPAGWTSVNSGLSANDCIGQSNDYFCFDNPDTPMLTLAPDSSLQLKLGVVTSVDGLFPYTPHFQMDWEGSIRHYDLVSEYLVPVSVVPELEPYAMLLTGLGVAGFVVHRRKLRRE